MDANGTRPIAFPPNTIGRRHPKKERETRKKSDEEGRENPAEDMVSIGEEADAPEGVTREARDANEEGSRKRLIDIRV
jgi:hypothetical protein